MANEFICFDCKGDGTRCSCEWKARNRSLVDHMETAQERIDRMKHEIDLEARRIGVVWRSKDIFND